MIFLCRLRRRRRVVRPRGKLYELTRSKDQVGLHHARRGEREFDHHHVRRELQARTRQTLEHVLVQAPRGRQAPVGRHHMRGSIFTPFFFWLFFVLSGICGIYPGIYNKPGRFIRPSLQFTRRRGVLSLCDGAAAARRPRLRGGDGEGMGLNESY